MTEHDETNRRGAVNAETLAAFLDGKLDARERARVLEQLSGSDEAYEALIEAAQTLDELEAQESQADDDASASPGALHGRRRDASTPVRGERRQRWHRRAWLPLGAAAAAVLAALLLLPRSAFRGDAESAYMPGALAVALVEPARGGLPDGWIQPPWRLTRAGGATADEAAIAFRAGVRLVDLEVAARAGDGAAARQASADLATLLEPLAAGAPFLPLFGPDGAAIGAGEDAAGLRERVWNALARALDADLLRLGAWAEAARLAALARDRAFFESEASRTALRSIAAAELPPDLRAAVDAASAAAAEAALSDWNAFLARIEAVMRTAAR